MGEPCRDPQGTHNRPPASGSPLLPVLPLLPVVLVLVSVCVSSPAGVAKGSSNTREETKSLQGIPDVTIPMGKIFHYPVPVQGTTTQYKVTSASGAALPKWLEFDSQMNTLQGLPMAGEGGVYLLSITASGRLHAQEAPGAAANFTIHVQDSSSSLEESLNHMPNSYQCGQAVAITSAEILLSTGAEPLEAPERLRLVHTMAGYLRLEPSLLTLLPSPAPRGSHSPTLLAEHTGHVGNHHVGLSWPVSCGGFAELQELTQVLQHNVGSPHLSRLLGYDISGWRILRTGDDGRRSPRRQRRQLMITPTPTLKPLRLTPTPAAGGAARPLAFSVPSLLLTPLVASPSCGAGVTTASDKMGDNTHLVTQESSVTLDTDPAWDMPTNPPASLTFAGSASPDLSPSLITATRFLLAELEVLPAGASGTSLLVEQLEPHVPETDSSFLPSKSEIPTDHLLQDIPAGTGQLSRPLWVTDTLHEWPHSSAEPFPPKTHVHGFLPEAMSVSGVPGYSDKAKSYFPELQMLLSASLSPETLSPEASASLPGMLTSTVTSGAASVSPSGTKELHSDRDLGTRGILPNVTKPTLESHKTSDIKPDAVEVPLVTLCNANSHLPSSTAEAVQTLLPWQQDPSTLLFPTSETLQSMETAWILPPLSVSQEPQTTTRGRANTPPKVVQSINSLTATLGCLFSFPVPADTFHDEEDGNSTRLSLHVAPADGSPSGPESWLQFNSSQQSMHGYPLDVDLQYSPQAFVLSATDSGGLTARGSFTVELLRPTDTPCHTYTLRTRNSYHSFLRERGRVTLFLEKLSLYLNCSSPQELVVVALQPGSTLISWYDGSLCARADGSSGWCARDEIQGALQKLGVPGGHVSPRFAQAMLPEYRVDVLVSVSYSGLCSGPTRPCHSSPSSAVPALQAKNDSTVGKSPPALLSSLCATAGVVLVILVWWLWKCPRRIPGCQSVLSQRSSQLGCAGVELDVLKPRKAPVHECRAAAPPPSWSPPRAPLTSQNQHPRALPLPHSTPPFQPPKYQLPPCYGEGVTTQHGQGNSQRLKLGAFKYY